VSGDIDQHELVAHGIEDPVLPEPCGSASLTLHNARVCPCREVIDHETTTSLTNPVEADFDNALGVSDVAAMTVTVKSNKTASATIHSAAGFWTGGTGAKAIGDLGYSTTGAAPYAAITGSGVNIVPAGKGSNSKTVSWNTQWHLATDEPGLYSLPVTFTLVVP
jgi:hypothetical protein